jgi:DNA-binding MarR family transcriptional regulator
MPSSPNVEPAVRVPASFDGEFPTASRRATETFLNLGLLVGGVRGAVEAIVAAEGLPSMAAFNVLSVLGGDASPLRPSIIAERMMVTRATITGVLDSLEARKLIRRLASPTDRRSRDVVLTRAGRDIVDRLVPRMHAFERDLMCVLSDRRLDELLEMVSVLQQRIRTLAPRSTLGIR